MAVDDDIRNADSSSTAEAPQAPLGYVCVIDAIAMLEAAKLAKHDGARTLTKAERLRIERSCASDLQRAITVSRGVRLFDSVTLSETSAGPTDDGYLHSLVRLDELRRFACERLNLELGGDIGAAALPSAIRYGDLPEWLAARQCQGDDFRAMAERAVAADNWKRDLMRAVNRGELVVRTPDTREPIDMPWDEGLVLTSELRPLLEGRDLGHLLASIPCPVDTESAPAGAAAPPSVPEPSARRTVSKAPPPITPVRGAGYSLPPPILERARWHVWRHIPQCNLWCAVCLSLDIEPADELISDVVRGEWKRSGLPREFWDRLMVCIASVHPEGPIRSAGELPGRPGTPVAIADVAAFLAGAQFEIPEQMRSLSRAPAEALTPAGGASLRTALPSSARSDRESGETEPERHDEQPPVSAAGRQGSDWKAAARTLASEICQRNRANNLFPSQELVAEEIARRFRADGIFGPTGLPLSPATIKRHALKGISSGASARAPTRGKQGK
ncbi:MAG: hypothetical protein KJ011_05315 [Burkholderiaceae bacterium]|nr:hypothetical protein [Burkholderiaceae bacterium]